MSPNYHKTCSFLETIVRFAENIILFFKKLILVLFFLLPFHNGLSQRTDTPGSYISKLSKSDQEILLKNRELTRFYQNGEAPTLIPTVSFQEKIERVYHQFKHQIGVESIFMLPIEKTRTDLEVYNILRQISTLKGIQYYSKSRGRMRILFNETFYIEDTKHPRRLPDPIVGKIPPESSIKIYQEDTTFDKSISEVRYLYDNGVFGLYFTNLTPLEYMFIDLVDPQKMKMSIVILQDQTNYLFYGICEVETFNLFGLARSYEKNFYHRFKALFNWFEMNISR
jgi:hypothetical protein